MISDHDKIFKNLPNQQTLSLTQAQQQGDWVDLKKILVRSSDSLLEEVEKSQLREKDNIAQVVSEKWKPFLERENTILVFDASRASPGEVAFLHLLLYETHKVIEGALLTAFILGSERGYFYISSEYREAFEIMQKALEECYAQGLLGDHILGTNFFFHLHIHLGSSDYVSYRSQSLIDSLSGRNQPSETLFGHPVLIHKIETIASLSTLLRRGAGWFSSLGTTYSRGTKIFSFLGHVNNPCVVEESFGISLRSSIEKYAGGIKGGWPHLNVIFPGGLENAFLPRSSCDNLALSYEGLSSVHSCLGSGSIVAVNGSTNLMTATLSIMDFFKRVPSGCCLFCTKGMRQCIGLLKSISSPQEQNRDSVMIALKDLCEKIENRCECGYGTHSLSPIKAYLFHIRDTHKLDLMDVSPYGI